MELVVVYRGVQIARVFPRCLEGSRRSASGYCAEGKVGWTRKMGGE
jgi:hypothetical protein